MDQGRRFLGENAGTLEKEGIKYDGTGLLVGGDLGFAETICVWGCLEAATS